MSMPLSRSACRRAKTGEGGAPAACLVFPNARCVADWIMQMQVSVFRDVFGILERPGRCRVWQREDHIPHDQPPGQTPSCIDQAWPHRLGSSNRRRRHPIFNIHAAAKLFAMTYVMVRRPCRAADTGLRGPCRSEQAAL
jgi:hypothetical protein